MRITVYPMSNVHHLHQLLSGFDSVANDDGTIVRFRFDGRQIFDHQVSSAYDHRAMTLLAQVEGGPLICYDTHDSSKYAANLYERADVYFKRSYHPVEHAELPKMQPLGLYLRTTSKGGALAAARRSLALDRGKMRVKELARLMNIPGAFRLNEDLLNTVPAVSRDPRVNLQLRTWDPAESAVKLGDQAKRDREAINEQRAECLRALRSAFGPRFEGGFEPSAYAARHFPDLILDKSQTARSAYISNLRRYDICIATEGLHRSTGGKFAEYLALGRAIVTTPMAFSAGPDLEEGRHYLTFRTPEECVEQVSTLLDDVDRRAMMMQENYRYYRAHVTPRSLVVNSLARAVAGAGGMDD